MQPVCVATEGLIDTAVVRRIFQEVELEIAAVYGESGKEYLVNLVRRSRSRTIRDDVVPRDGSRARVGPGYAGRMIEFASTIWSPHEASVRSDSLKRCLDRLARFGVQ